MTIKHLTVKSGERPATGDPVTKAKVVVSLTAPVMPNLGTRAEPGGATQTKRTLIEPLSSQENIRTNRKLRGLISKDGGLTDENCGPSS
jgi:hypothetical protein